MKLENTFRVPVPPEVAWRVLLDVERIAPCMPGATLTGFEGDNFTGTVKVKVGPISLTYGGKAAFVSKDEAARVVVIEGTGKETRGSGTAKATVTCRLVDADGVTEVRVDTDLAVTGKPAQFGRGVMAEVSGKLIDQFAACLAEEITAGGDHAGAAAPAPRGEVPEGSAPAQPGTGDPAAEQTAPTPAGAPRIPRPRVAAEPINLVETAGLPVLKRAAPVLLALVGLLVILRVLRRR